MNHVSQGSPTSWFPVVSGQGSGLMEWLLELLSGTDWFWSFSWKTLPRQTLPVVLFSCLALWPGSLCHSCFIVNMEKIQLSPVFGATTSRVIHHTPLLKLRVQPGCCPAVHNVGAEKPQVSLTLIYENPTAVSSPDTVRPRSGTVCFS